MEDGDLTLSGIDHGDIIDGVTIFLAGIILLTIGTLQLFMAVSVDIMTLIFALLILQIDMVMLMADMVFVITIDLIDTDTIITGITEELGEEYIVEITL